MPSQGISFTIVADDVTTRLSLKAASPCRPPSCLNCFGSQRHDLGLRPRERVQQRWFPYECLPDRETDSLSSVFHAHCYQNIDGGNPSGKPSRQTPCAESARIRFGNPRSGLGTNPPGLGSRMGRRGQIFYLGVGQQRTVSRHGPHKALVCLPILYREKGGRN